MEFKEKVYQSRMQLGLTQIEFAKILGVSFASINRWENGITYPNKLNAYAFDRFCKNNNIIFESDTATNVEHTLNCVDLFSGAGGLQLGFEKEGFTIIFSTDFDSDCELVHIKNRPNIPFLKIDIRNLTNEMVDAYINGQNVDVLVGGPPCQGFSTIGNRASSDELRRKKHDDRNDLFREYIRILNHIKPKFFLMENVKGLLTRDGGRIYEEIKHQFHLTGYKVNSVILNAADYGVPQIRERIFFYGTRMDVKFEPPMPTHGPGLMPYKTVNDAIGDLADKKDGEVPNHYALKHGTKNLERYRLIPEGGRLPEDSLPKELYRKNFGNTFKRLHRDKPSLTMVPGHNAFPIHPWLNRSLTVREAARIQTFPDDYIFYGPRQKQCMQVGNAVPPLFAQQWAKTIKRLLNNG